MEEKVIINNLLEKGFYYDLRVGGVMPEKSENIKMYDEDGVHNTKLYNLYDYYGIDFNLKMLDDRDFVEYWIIKFRDQKNDIKLLVKGKEYSFQNINFLECIDLLNSLELKWELKLSSKKAVAIVLSNINLDICYGFGGASSHEMLTYISMRV